IAHPESFLEAIILQSHYAIQEMGKSQEPPIEAGTTAVLCLVQEGMAWWAHAGDSRFYLFRNGLPLYRTKDDSYVEQLYQQGQLSMEKRDGHPMRNLVTQCIGLHNISPEVTVSKGVELVENDILLLCSDGFWEPLDDAQMGAMIEQGSLNDALAKLAERAEQASYPKSDNTSALAIKVFSLQLIDKPEKPPIEAIHPRDEDSLTGAISEIERAIEQYEDEMKE
ncbi:MAG: serine/threonine-protein phosphatase, partial [Thioalkalispiraceae bacterium]